jgi:hypothetical protein
LSAALAWLFYKKLAAPTSLRVGLPVISAPGRAGSRAIILFHQSRFPRRGRFSLRPPKKKGYCGRRERTGKTAAAGGFT